MKSLWRSSDIEIIKKSYFDNEGGIEQKPILALEWHHVTLKIRGKKLSTVRKRDYMQRGRDRSITGRVLN
jgi:hypothetical protein